MTPLRRWCLVALVAVLLAASPFAGRLLPVTDSALSASALLGRVRDSGDQSYSGYVETAGTVQLQVGDRFSDVGDLFSERTRLRVWWQDEETWRVDHLLVSGETDLVRRGGVTTEYDYEDAKAVSTRDPEIRLPRTADLVPPTLARMVLSGAVDSEVARLPSRRVAGFAAPGLRLTPASTATTIDHVDLWADPGSGLPLRVEVYSDGSREPDFTTEFRGFSSASPAAADVAFAPSRQVERDFQDTLDIADAANQFAPLFPPGRIAGIEMSSQRTGAVGVYGTGVTRLIAIPLRDREAAPLREQLKTSPGVQETDNGTVVAVGPLGVLLTGSGDVGGWLVAGTVTADTLDEAARDLLAHSVFEDRQ